MDVIEQSLEDGILIVTLNRPKKLNTLNDDVLQGLSEILTAAKTNARVAGLLITGRGRAFCAGADINRLAACDAQSGFVFAKKGQAIFRQLETLGKPSIAAVNGFAFGGGCELAMSATLRIASSQAQFGQPEVKLGIIPGYGGTQRLARLVGKGRALDLCLSARFIDADTALNWGLVTEVVADDALVHVGKQRLQTILSMGPLAIKATMEVIDSGFDMPLPDALAFEALHFAKVCASQDKQEGVSAFLEKRVAAFKGV